MGPLLAVPKNYMQIFGIADCGPDELHENIWDHVAGVIVAEEAGGKVTDMVVDKVGRWETQPEIAAVSVKGGW